MCTLTREGTQKKKTFYFVERRSSLFFGALTLNAMSTSTTIPTSNIIIPHYSLLSNIAITLLVTYFERSPRGTMCQSDITGNIQGRVPFLEGNQLYFGFTQSRASVVRSAIPLHDHLVELKLYQMNIPLHSITNS